MAEVQEPAPARSVKTVGKPITVELLTISEGPERSTAERPGSAGSEARQY